MKYLVVSGCSVTSEYNTRTDPDDKYDFIKWPELLKNKLCPDAKLINVAFSGAGNEYILHSLLNELIELPSNSKVLCIAAWSGYLRESWMTESQGLGIKSSDKKTWIHDNFTHDPQKGKVEYYKKSTDYCIKKTNLYRYTLSKFCNDLDITFVDFNTHFGHNTYRQDSLFKFINLKHSLFDNFETIFNVIEELKHDKFKIAKDDWHPNLDGHKLIAERLYNEIQRMGY